MITWRRSCEILVASCAILFLGQTAVAGAGVVVIGSKNIANLSADQLKDIFLGKEATLPDGTSAEVSDLPEGNSTRDEFYKKVIEKDPSQVKAYWAKRIFTGKGSPPEVKANNDAVKAWVAGGAGRLGYIDGSAVDDTVKVLLKP